MNKKVIRSNRAASTPVTGTESPDPVNPVSAKQSVKSDEAELQELIEGFKEVSTSVTEEKPVEKESGVLGDAEVVSVPDSTPVTAHAPNTGNLSAVYEMRKAAYLYRVQLMNESMGPGITCGMEQAAMNQKEYSRVLEAFITTIPPDEVRSAMTVILNEYNRAPVLSPRCLMKGIINTKTSEATMPEWFVQLSTLFSMASKPETRFQTVGKTFDLNRVSPKVPALLMERIQEFFRA